MLGRCARAWHEHAVTVDLLADARLERSAWHGPTRAMFAALPPRALPSPPLSSMDIVEVNPLLEVDGAQRTVEFAIDLVGSSLGRTILDE